MEYCENGDLQLFLSKCLDKQDEKVRKLQQAGKKSEPVVQTGQEIEAKAVKRVDFVPSDVVAHLEAALPFSERFRILREVASAMLYLHQRDIIHRDVKAENVLMDQNFTAKVMDFGLYNLYLFFFFFFTLFCWALGISKILSKDATRSENTRQIGTRYFKRIFHSVA